MADPRILFALTMSGPADTKPKWTDQSRAEYLAEWYLWRALRRDDRLNADESRARHDGLVAFITTRFAGRAPGL